MFRRALRALTTTPVISYCRLILPDEANLYGNCHGGTILKMCEAAGFVATSEFCNFENDPVALPSEPLPPSILPVLAHLSDVTFLEPMRVGDLAKLTAKPVFSSKHSVDVMVDVYAESLLNRSFRKTNTAVLTYVGTDPERYNRGNPRVNPCPIPRVIPKTEAEQKMYEEMKRQYESRKREVAQAKPGEVDQYVLVSPRTSTLVHVTEPGDCWGSKYVSGGVVMKLLDTCAAVAAHSHCHSAAVTVSIDALNFRYPATLGDVLYVYATPVFASAKSLEIMVHVEIARYGPQGSDKRILTTRGKFSFVAVDSKGKTIPIPPVNPETPAEKRAYDIAKAAYEKRKAASAGRKAAPK